MFCDHETLMMVTREFARERGLRLPEGYDKQKVIERKRAAIRLPGTTNGSRTAAACL
jgi:hypothetical protein